MITKESDRLRKELEKALAREKELSDKYGEEPSEELSAVLLFETPWRCNNYNTPTTELVCAFYKLGEEWRNVMTHSLTDRGRPYRESMDWYDVTSFVDDYLAFKTLSKSLDRLPTREVHICGTKQEVLRCE